MYIAKLIKYLKSIKIFKYCVNVQKHMTFKKIKNKK